ncbi:hypothetical protein Dcar01_03341 [Deinococcus carri]|uniref:DUF2339 domain-containing protein n=1 Tax=Deinococcus carri TaxID=1211323 RepID=A0ABP9WCX1_9DEIO
MTLLLLALLVLGLVLLARLGSLTREMQGLRERLAALERQAGARASAQATPEAEDAPVARPGPAEERGPTPEPPAALPTPAGSPWPEDQEVSRPPARAPLSSRTVFAVLGAAVTLVGAAWFLAALARSGLLTREVLLGLAALLAASLYAAAGRTAPVIGEALRGLGYGILALCLGALVGAGVAPAGTVLAAILVLSLAVGVHGTVQGRLLGTATALSGASLSTWLLADNLGDPTLPGLALLGVAAGTVLAERRLNPAGSALLAPLPAAGLLGLIVTTRVHDQPGHPLLWALLLLGAVGAALAVGLRPGTAGKEASLRPPLAAAGVLLAGLAGAAPLLQPLEEGRGLPGGLPTTALLLVGAVCTGLALWLHRLGERRRPGTALLRDAVLGVGVGTLGGALALGMEGWRPSTRLLGLASGVALLGSWLRSRVWRWVGAAALGMLLADHLLHPWPSSLVVAGLALGSGLALAGRAGAAVTGVAAAVLLRAVSAPSGVLGELDAGPRFLAAAGVVVVLSALTLGLERWGQERFARTLVWGALAAGALLVPLGLAHAGSAWQVAAHGLLSGGLLYALAAVHRPLLPPRWRGGLEGAGVATAALGLLVWTQEGDGEERAALLLALLTVGVALLPGESRWFWRAWPLLALAVLVSVASMLTGPRDPGAGLWLLLGALGTGAALWLLVTLAGLRWLARRPDPRGDTARAASLVAPPLLQDGLWPGLALVLLALGGRTAELLVRGEGPLTFTLTSTVVLLAASVALLVQARQLGHPLRWWVALATFGLGALKLVFVDLDDLGGLFRGAATALLGLLLLGIGQLAPRPEEEPAES